MRAARTFGLVALFGLGGCGGLVEPTPCSFETDLVTRPGPCAEAGKECGEACGACASGETCFESRCYAPLGTTLASWPPMLMRSVYSIPEGIRCTATEDGKLERVEAAIWHDNVPDITMEVYLRCSGQMQRASSMTLKASAFPEYAGIHGEMRATTFVLNTPLEVQAGDRIDVVFSSHGSPSLGQSAVVGLHKADVDANCKFASYNNFDGIGKDPNWDFMARLHLHPSHGVAQQE